MTVDKRKKKVFFKELERVGTQLFFAGYFVANMLLFDFMFHATIEASPNRSAVVALIILTLIVLVNVVFAAECYIKSFMKK